MDILSASGGFHISSFNLTMSETLPIASGEESVIQALKYERISAGLLCGTAFLTGLLIYLLPPEKRGIYPPCLFHSLTGLYCPGCGGVRAIHNLLHGRILTALRFNPIVAILSIPVVLYFLYLGRFALTGRTFRWRIRLKNLKVKKGTLWILLAGMLLFWILRNINLYPFSLLAPPSELSRQGTAASATPGG